MRAYIDVDLDGGTAFSLEAAKGKVDDGRVWDWELHGKESSHLAYKGFVDTEDVVVFSKDGKVRRMMRMVTQRSESRRQRSILPSVVQSLHRLAAVADTVDLPFLQVVSPNPLH